MTLAGRELDIVRTRAPLWSIAENLHLADASQPGRVIAGSGAARRGVVAGSPSRAHPVAGPRALRQAIARSFVVSNGRAGPRWGAFALEDRMSRLRRLLPAPFAFALVAGTVWWMWVHTHPWAPQPPDWSRLHWLA